MEIPKNPGSGSMELWFWVFFCVSQDDLTAPPILSIFLLGWSNSCEREDDGRNMNEKITLSGVPETMLQTGFMPGPGKVAAWGHSRPESGRDH